MCRHRVRFCPILELLHPPAPSSPPRTEVLVLPTATIFDHHAGADGHRIVDELIAGSLVHSDEWKDLPTEVQQQILRSSQRAAVMALLVEHGLLTAYQASRIEAGST